MKRVLVLDVIALLTAFLFVSCDRDATVSEVAIDRIVDLDKVSMRGLGEFVVDGVDSYIGVSIDGRKINGECDMGGFSSWANFENGEDAPGKVCVNGMPLYVFEEKGKWRYLLNPSQFQDLLPPNFDPDEIARSGEVEISFESEVPNKYASFSETFTFPHPLCLDISSFHGDEQRISEDLTFTWEPDPRCDMVYVALCVPGKPCIFKQFDDASGSGVILASEFADFPVGESAWFAIGRGMGSVVEQSDGRKTGILRYTYVLAIATLVP